MNIEQAEIRNSIRHKYREFFKAHGYKYDITTGYGSSEAGGKPMFAPKGNDRDILGFAEDSENIHIFRITRERIGGEAYDLVPVFTDGELTDIQTKHVENVNSMTAGTVPHGMENHSAYNIFDLFNTAVPSGKTTGSSPHEPLGGFFEALFPSGDKSRTGGDMPEIPNHVREALLKYGNRLIGMIYTGRKSIDFDFEDDSER